MKQPIISKSELLAGIRSELKTTKLPESIVLNSCTTINNPAKFFESHLAVVEAQDGPRYKPYSDRLKQVCGIVGIDLIKIAKSKFKSK